MMLCGGLRSHALVGGGGVSPQFLSGVSVSGSTVDSPNPLLIVNNKTNVVGKLPVRQAPGSVTVVEGNHMVATGRAAARK